MGNEIQVGMKFGTFNGFIEENKKQAGKMSTPISFEHYQFFNKQGKCYAEAMRQDYVRMEDGVRKYDMRITAYNEKYQYTAINKGMNSSIYYPEAFTRIDTDTQYAIDKNNNGIVDKGEIFQKEQSGWLN